jgi:hypothetical protein
MTKFQKWELLFSKFIQEGISAVELEQLHELESFLKQESLKNINWKEVK